MFVAASYAKVDSLGNARKDMRSISKTLLKVHDFTCKVTFHSRCFPEQWNDILVLVLQLTLRFSLSQYHQHQYLHQPVKYSMVTTLDDNSYFLIISWRKRSFQHTKIHLDFSCRRQNHLIYFFYFWLLHSSSWSISSKVVHKKVYSNQKKN